MQKTEHKTYSFGEFTLDLTRGALFHGADEVKLRLKSFEVLKFLTENPGRLVGKDELIDFVWQGMAVTDDSLVQCLKDIRTALNDRSQNYIRTVPRRGYIFEKEVSDNGGGFYLEETTGVRVVIEDTNDQNLDAQQKTLGDRKTIVSGMIALARRRKTPILFAGLVLASLVFGGVFLLKPVVMRWLKPPSVAILPVVNSTGDPSLDYISDGLTESIITSLRQLNEPGNPRVLLTALNTVLIFKGKDVDPRSTGRDLGVDTILLSRMYFQNGLRIFKFEMVNVADGSIIWSQQYSARLRPLDDFLEIQNTIPGDIAGQLPLQLSDDDRHRLTRRYTQNSEAYYLFLRGREATRISTPSSVRKSIEYFQQAIDLDPSFAQAYWGMGVSYWNQGAFDERPQKEANEKAVYLFERALKIDNTLQAANEWMKRMELYGWDWKAIEETGKKHPTYSDYLVAMGRIDEALKDEDKKLSVDPMNPLFSWTHAGTLILAGRLDEAIAQYQKTLSIVSSGRVNFGPESPWLHVALGTAYIEKGMHDDAITEMKKAEELAEGSEAMHAMLGYAYARAGRKDDAIRVLEELKVKADAGEYVSPLNIAFIHIALGDRDQAFIWLDKAFEERTSRLQNIKTSAIYAPLRSDPRYAELVRRMGLPM